MVCFSPLPQFKDTLLWPLLVVFLTMRLLTSCLSFSDAMYLSSSLETLKIFIFITGPEHPQSHVPWCVVFPPSVCLMLGVCLFIKFLGSVRSQFTSDVEGVLSLFLQIFFLLFSPPQPPLLWGLTWAGGPPAVVPSSPALCSLFL